MDIRPPEGGMGKRDMCLDTGVVFAGKLTALRYPQGCVPMFFVKGLATHFPESFEPVLGQGEITGGGLPLARSVWLLCGFGCRGVVECGVAEHGEEDVAAAPGEGDQGLVVPLAFGPFLVVGGA